MNLRLWMGLLLIAGLVCFGCDANRGKKVASADGAGANNPAAGSGPATGVVAEPSDYDNFVVKYPESFDGQFNPDGMTVGPKVGQLAPEISGVDLEGTEFKLSDYRGKVVMLDFYGDW